MFRRAAVCVSAVRVRQIQLGSAGLTLFRGILVKCSHNAHNDILGGIADLKYLRSAVFVLMNICRTLCGTPDAEPLVVTSISCNFTNHQYISFTMSMNIALGAIQANHHRPSFRVATFPEKVTLTLTPAKSGSELNPATPTPLKSRNLPYIVEPNPESDSDSYWEKRLLQASPPPGIVAALPSFRDMNPNLHSRSE